MLRVGVGVPVAEGVKVEERLAPWLAVGVGVGEGVGVLHTRRRRMWLLESAKTSEFVAGR